MKRSAGLSTGDLDMPRYWKNVSTLSIDEILGELRDIAALEEKKTLRGDLVKRKAQLRARLKMLRKAHA